MYQVGDIQLLKPDDPTFPSLPAAVTHAMQLSFAAQKAHEVAFFGVWSVGANCSLVAIVHDAEVFVK